MSYLSFENNIIEASGNLILKSNGDTIDCCGCNLINVSNITSSGSGNSTSFNSDVDISGNLTIDGSLIIQTGELTLIKTKDLDISDNIIGLNRGNTSKNTSGMLINYGDASNIFFGYHNEENAFVIADTSYNHDDVGRDIVVDKYVDLKVGNTTIYNDSSHAILEVRVKNDAELKGALINKLNSEIRVFGSMLGTSKIVWGEDNRDTDDDFVSQYGGCIYYNGDDVNPKTEFRRITTLNHTDYDSFNPNDGDNDISINTVFEYGHNNNDVTFYGNVTAPSITTDSITNKTNDTPLTLTGYGNTFTIGDSSGSKNTSSVMIEAPSITTDSITNKTTDTPLTLTGANSKTFIIGFSYEDSGIIKYKHKSNTTMIEAPSFNATSDYRTKTNIEELDENITVSNLRPLVYLKNGQKEIGLLAHELQEVYPFMVCGEKDGKEMQSVNYNGLIGVLINDVKRLTNENQILKLNNDTLKSDYDTLKSRLDSFEEKFNKRFE
jgi:hypothetical protein